MKYKEMGYRECRNRITIIEKQIESLEDERRKLKRQITSFWIEMKKKTDPNWNPKDYMMSISSK
jgi:chromosome segregation ATPase